MSNESNAPRMGIRISLEPLDTTPDQYREQLAALDASDARRAKLRAKQRADGVVDRALDDLTDRRKTR